MTGRELLLTTFKGGMPDRLPFVPILNDYFLSTLPSDIRTYDPVDACRILGVDIADRWVISFKGYYINSYYGEDHFNSKMFEGSRIKIQEVATSSSNYTIYETPIGTLNGKISENKYAGSTKFIEEPLIKTIGDINVYQYIWEAIEPYAEYYLTKKRLEYIRNDGIAMILVPCTPITQLIKYDLGLEKTNYFLNDYPKKMENLLDLMAEKAIKACKIAADSPAMVGIIDEDTSTLLMSPKQFGNYCVPIISNYASIYKNKKKYLFLHACGHLKGLLKQISAINGLSGIDSLAPPPTGNTTIEYAKEVLRDDMTIIGGLDPIKFLRATPKELEETVLKIIEKVRPGKHFILMPSDSTPAGVKVENFKAVTETINKYGKW